MARLEFNVYIVENFTLWECSESDAQMRLYDWKLFWNDQKAFQVLVFIVFCSELVCFTLAISVLYA